MWLLSDESNNYCKKKTYTISTTEGVEVEEGYNPDVWFLIKSATGSSTILNCASEFGNFAFSGKQKSSLAHILLYTGDDS